MSQSHNPKDSQALLQSMLQRLKLQPGREGQEFLPTPAPVTDGERAASNFSECPTHKVNTSPVNGIQFAVDSNSVPKGSEIQQPGQCKVDGGLISFPSQKDNIEDDTGEKRVVGQAALPEITPTGRGQPFPAKSLKDSHIASFERTDGEIVSCGGPYNQDALTSMGQNQDQNQGFTPKGYMWSLKPTDASPQVGEGENKMGNGDSTQRKDAQFVTTSPNDNSSSRRKQRTPENRTRRWTQKIKEKWRDKQGRSSKKGKEEGGTMNQRSEQVSPQNQLLTGEKMINTSNKEEEKTLPSLDSSDPSKIPPAHTEDSLERRSRSYSDFDFGLGSFSLLEEIVTGQEWAKFLTPNPSATLVNQRPSEEPLSQFKTPPHPYSSVQSSFISSQQGGGNNQWSFWGNKASSGSNFGTAQISPNASLSVSMEVSEGKQQETLYRQADQSEPMDDGTMQPAERRLGQQRRPPSFVQLQPVDILDKSRTHPNRKRQHQSAGVERLQTEKKADGELSISAPSATGNHEMDETGGSQNDNIMPLYTLNSPTRPSPSSSNPSAPAPRGVLKHSISQDSESSRETMTKRRRVEENRRVRFSEEVLAIEPLEVDLDAAESEEDSEEEEDSVIEQECEVEQAPVEEVAPARRHALPAWILALKRNKKK